MVKDALKEAEFKMKASLQALVDELARIRTGRASPSLIEGLMVEYYGTPTPLSQCANLMITDARLITVKPWDKNMTNDIAKAIQSADIGITPQNAGDLIRLPIPKLTEERRRDLVKQAKQRGEEARIALRNQRRDANDMLKESEKDKEISQDDLKRGLEKVQADLDVAIKRVDEIISAKETDILEI